MSIEELEERMAADGETRNQSESEIEAEHEEQPEEEEDEDDNSSAQGSVVASKKRKEGPENGEARTQTRAKKVQIEYIPQKERRQVTFSKRKAGIMKKAYELSTLTGTQVLLLIVSENGVVYSFTTEKFKPLVGPQEDGTPSAGQRLIQSCVAGENYSDDEQQVIPAPPEQALPAPPPQATPDFYPFPSALPPTQGSQAAPQAKSTSRRMQKSTSRPAANNDGRGMHSASPTGSTPDPPYQQHGPSDPRRAVGVPMHQRQSSVGIDYTGGLPSRMSPAVGSFYDDGQMRGYPQPHLVYGQDGQAYYVNANGYQHDPRYAPQEMSTRSPQPHLQHAPPQYHHPLPPGAPIPHYTTMVDPNQHRQISPPAHQDPRRQFALQYQEPPRQQSPHIQQSPPRQPSQEIYNAQMSPQIQ